ncbi:hypothetical protein PGQ11_012199 [Apiospora arundinis]|uniref:Fork-head domain-containing protein n=1 Tax=Apiospora arundinis TaxID=335852 RepID=A0ABR2I287_9PEZI
MVVVYSVMNSGLCDGMPVNYTSSPTSDSTGNPKRLCTTQSPDGDLPNLDSFYNPSPTLDATETVQQQQHQHPSHILPTLNTAAAIQTYPQIHSASSSTPSMLATPPSTAGVDHEEYTYQGSPGSCGAAHVPALSARSSDTSPRSWSSPDLQQLNYPPGFYQISKGQDFPPYGGPQPVIATAEDSFPTQPMETCAYSASNSPLPGDYGKNDPTSTMSQEAPGMTPDHADSVMTPDSPLPKHEYNCSYPYEEDGGGGDMPNLHHPDQDEAMDDDELAKGDESYAKLMERAFKSRPNLAMTLQELYQWFRENTERGRSETKGWQNSVRHNLSMNGAFEKRERRPSIEGSTTASGEPKRSNEWVLTEQAALHGVQSTTRFRKGNSSGRRAPSRSHHQQGGSSARAVCGRKGGLTASKTKAANNRALLKRQSMGVIPQHHHYHGAGSSSSYHDQQRHRSIAFYQPRLQHHDYLHGGRHHLSEADYARSIPHHDESETSEGGSLLQYASHHPIDSSMGTSLGSAQGYYQPQPYLASQATQQPYAHHDSYSHHHHHHQHQHQPPHPYHPQRPETQFKVEHATSVYEPPVTSSPSSTAIHGVYASVFTNELGEGTPENPVRPTTLPYRTSSTGWAESAQS